MPLGFVLSEKVIYIIRVFEGLRTCNLTHKQKSLYFVFLNFCVLGTYVLVHKQKLASIHAACAVVLFTRRKNEQVTQMIEYSPFWNTLNHSKESTYTLINVHHISSSTIDRIRKNKPITTTTIDDLCKILCCNVEDILQFVPSELT